ncbi:MAG: endonuclease III domain-containing protein [Caldisericaceae bacterium]
MVGAILTQQTSWKNVEKAIINLKERESLSPFFLRDIPLEELQEVIRPSGFYVAKAATLKRFVEFFFEAYGASIDKMKQFDTNVLRNELLKIKGIGRETADSVILYAMDKPIFPVDNYTKRIYLRTGISSSTDYEELRQITEQALQTQNFVSDLKEFHALLVKLGKDFCKKIPKCELCPINNNCIKKGVKYE